ncbi:flagellar basal body-associated protein FliL [Trinickia caryophylli]|uniref:Flagellar protein FliL n=1 Tax=Trinickia caryophylli TaxID=28094 RepID=A0A1X7FH18_TRICW|nr:flagellar basal body-associated protein FliL [Trinickia caryophylli]PMS13258.1 flagellar basal body-associated protein FliL [Trinickia caryophylli]TRX19216.1 flagellar basal body-associated protein FliL [Trinickia caryophylli]WQE13485.1 flagellar basal body-associated protein FliL [Trinickia caryophylli]SMF52007.1 flagellar FliL protein [Trinickia caryophylli]GLU33987.1 flagellar basal body-associated protein FliL [Trinickia caryophylli]
MATTTATQQPVATPPKSAKLKRILLIVLIALVAAGAAAGGTYFFLAKHGPSKPVAPPPPPPPVFFALEPMTVNLLSDDGQHYLRVGLTLKIADEKMQARLTEHMPELRSRILLDLSNKHPEDLSTLDGKRALADELKKLIEEPTDHGAPPIEVKDVLFTEFVVQ